MKLFYSIVSNTAMAINLVLLFFLFVADQVVVPEWLQAVGRMHPMLLHLPIGLLLLLAVLPLIRKHMEAAAFYQIHLFVLALASVTAAITALMGFLLARESGYGSDLVDRHQWLGIGLSWMTYGLFVWLNNRTQVSRIFQIGLLADILVLIVAGHLGAGITHGEDFVWAPLIDDEPAITEATPIYQALIVPLFQQKCFSCHNEQKAKGGLVMTDPKRFKKGGDTGVAFAAGNVEESLLIQRLELPMEQEEHMPPEGKPQLSTQEIDLLKHWIAGGADMELPIRDLAEDSPLKPLAMSRIEATQEADRGKVYDFSAAAPATIEALNIPFRTLTPLANGSPALRGAIFIRETYDKRFLKELLAVKDQLVDLKLDHLPIEDDELAVIGEFHRLEKLNLNNTDLSGQGLETLAGCVELRSLSLSGIPVDTSLAAILRQLPKLEEVFVWNTGLDTTAVRTLQDKFPTVRIDAGYVPEDELMQLGPPVVKRVKNLEGEEEIQLDHKFPGAVIRYSVDGADPDSIDSPIYEEPLRPNQFAIIKARAFRDNWLGSEMVSATYFPKSISLKEARLLTRPNQKYTGSGAAGLIDGQKGFAGNFQSPFWLGFRKEPFAALVYPEDPSIPITTITLSYLHNLGSYIMIPRSVEVWGGPDADHLRLLKRINPSLPQKYTPNEVKGLDIPIPASTLACYKIVAHPLPSLPAWHQGAGDRSWVFVDEIYLYNNASSALIPAGVAEARD